MKAILTLGHRRYLVPDAKKALAFAEFITKAQEVSLNWFETRDQIVVRPDKVECSIETISDAVKIIKKSEKSK